MKLTASSSNDQSIAAVDSQYSVRNSYVLFSIIGASHRVKILNKHFPSGVARTSKTEIFNETNIIIDIVLFQRFETWQGLDG
jgi:hypothetical protein